jgi:hypothetical protein
MEALIGQVSKEKKGKVVDSRCRDLTSAFACEKGRAEPGSVPLCSFHEVGCWLPDRVQRRRLTEQELNNYETGNLIPAGVHTLDDVKKYGIEKGVCPYFTIRRMVRLDLPANVDGVDALPRRDHLLIPLSARPEGRGERIGRA